LWNVSLPVAHIEMSIFVLSLFGLGVGFLAGFFGVGGGFVMTPLLMALGVPPPVAVGSGLAIMLGASVSGTIRHVQLGNVDLKLALLLLMGTVVGVQVGAFALDTLQRGGNLHFNGAEIDVAHFCLGLCYMVLLFGIGIVMLVESGRASERKPGSPVAPTLATRLQSLSLPPCISLPASGISSYPLALLLGMGAGVGALAGLLGVGGGTIMLPIMIYFIGLRAQRAVGTDLCQICFTAGVGAVSHAVRGNVDPVLAGIVLLGSLIGARLGASATNRVGSLHLRRCFGLFAIMVGLFVFYTFLRKAKILP
jgi:uncharacterized membrane protein YfcA